MKKIRIKPLVLITLCLSAITLFTHTAPPTHAQTGGTLNLLGHFGGRANAVFVDGDTAYIGMGGTLLIMNVSDPANPTVIEKTQLWTLTDIPPDTDIILDIEVVGNAAYIATSQSGFIIVDVSNLASPDILGSVVTDGTVTGVAVEGDVAYIVNSDNELVTIDVSNPTAPTLLGSYDAVGYVRAVEVVGSVAYITDSENGLLLVDVSNPSTPTLLGSYEPGGSIGSVKVVGSVAYITDSENGLVTVDVSNSATPSLLGAYNSTGSIHSVEMVGNMAYMMDSDNRLVIVDVSNPSAPTLLGADDIAGIVGFNEMKIVEGIAYIINDINGLVTVDVSNPSTPTLLGSYGTIAFGDDIEIVGSVAYIADANKLVTVDVSNPSTPVPLGSIDVVYVKSVKVVGSVAYVGGGGLSIIDVSNPSAPTLLGSYSNNINGEIRDIDVVGNIAYIASTSDGLLIMDVSDPTVPVLLGSYNTTLRFTQDVDVMGDVAYVLDIMGDGLSIVDVSNPSAPTLLGSVSIVNPIPRDIKVVGGVAYIANGSNGDNDLVAMDVSDPTSPVLLGSYDTPGQAEGVDVAGDVAYIADMLNGLVAVDVSNPSAPVLLASHNAPGLAQAISVVDDVIYVTSPSQGLYMFEYVPEPRDGDEYENDDDCANATLLETDGEIQTHTFHHSLDSDWVRFDVVAGERYVVSGEPTGGSQADLILELYDACETVQIDNQAHTFAPSVQVDFEAVSSGTIYLHWRNQTPAVYGDNVTYNVSVRQLGDESAVGATIIVAGRLNGTDELQPNIQAVTKDVFRLFMRNGYSKEDIYYLSTEPSDIDGDGVDDKDAFATTDNVRLAITDWASNMISAGSTGPLNIYLMDHGAPDKFFVDNVQNQVVRPSDLHTWISQVEADHPGLIVNIILEMCNAGSFIEDGDNIGESLSAPNRVVIASTGPYINAYASPTGGATFSDHLLPALDQDLTLYTSFERGRDAVRAARHVQEPWLDADGDQIPNTANDFTLASQRGFGISNTFPADLWPPFITEHAPIIPTAAGDGIISVQILDDPTSEVRPPYAVIYPPSYTPPEPGETLIGENDVLTTIILLDQGDDQWAANFTDFTEDGVYQIVIYAEDTDGMLARPYSFDVVVGDAPVTPTPEVPLNTATTQTRSTEMVWVIYVAMGAAVLLMAGTVCLKKDR